MLEDGTYDALVIDVDGPPDGELHVELTIVAGAHKGEVVAVRGRFPGRDPIDLMGLPATIVVTDGTPSVTMDA